MTFAHCTGLLWLSSTRSSDINSSGEICWEVQFYLNLDSSYWETEERVGEEKEGKGKMGKG